jgi:hypothetical protein
VKDVEAYAYNCFSDTRLSGRIQGNSDFILFLNFQFYFYIYLINESSFVVLGTTPRGLYMLGIYSTSEVYPQSHVIFLNIIIGHTILFLMGHKLHRDVSLLFFQRASKMPII